MVNYNFAVDEDGYIMIDDKLSATKDEVYIQIEIGGTTDFWQEKISEWRRQGILN